MSDEPNGDDETCAYVAREDDPSNWHGDEWILHRGVPNGLEQDIWECPHESLDGEEYCAFHTHPDDVPDDVDEGELFIEAVNGASAVEDEETARRKKEFVGATFGAFDIKGAVLDAGDDHPIRFDHARFARGVNAENAVFEHNVLATQTRFETGDGEATGETGKVSFESVEFGAGRVSFEHARFGEGEVSFEHARFGEGGVSFEFAEFGEGGVLFSGVEFGEGEVSFLRVEFGEGEVSFGGEFGEGEVSFEHARFGEGVVSFSGVEFGEGEVSFDSMTVAGPLFLDTQFDAELKMSLADAEFRDDVTFGSGDDEGVPHMQHSLDFSGATFRRELEFRGETDSTTGTEQSESTETRFDFVFAGDVDFSNVTFPDGVDFSATRFSSDVNFTDATLKDADFSGADVTDGGDISEVSFDGADLSGADFSDANLRGASLERARLNRAELLGTDLAGAKLYGALLGDARINRETEFWLPSDAEHRENDDSAFPLRAVRRVKNALRRGPEPYCAYDPRYRGEDGETDLEKAAEVYGTLETVATDNSLPGLASDCFLGRKDVQFKEYWKDVDIRMIFRSLVPNTVARYGESPFRVLGTGAFIVLICGLAYHAFNLIEKTSADGPSTLFDALYFSALTFTTLGYGDFNPTTQAGQVLAVAETSAGVILLAILVFVFGRRATR